jgi:catechol 2,3-dioxygenase-like lactoylglutathione lyase family enzyme
MFIELSQPSPLPATTAPPSSNVIGGRFATTVKDTDATLKFYKDVFGFDIKPGGPFASNPPVSQLVDVPGARFRMSRATLPGSTLSGEKLTWEFVDYQEVDRTPFAPSIPDPGAPAFSLRVTDADALAAAVKAAGGEIVSVGPPLGKAAGSIFVRDPNGFLLELIQRP